MQSGTIAGTVRDEQGGVLPGVTVTLTGTDRPPRSRRRADGRFRFLNVPPGTYKLATDLAGFSKIIREDLIVSVGTNLDLTFTMKVASRPGDRVRHRRIADRRRKAMGTTTNFAEWSSTRFRRRAIRGR